MLSVIFAIILESKALAKLCEKRKSFPHVFIISWIPLKDVVNFTPFNTNPELTDVPFKLFIL